MFLRFLPILISALVFLTFQFFYYDPQKIYWAIVAINLLVFYPFWYWARELKKQKEYFKNWAHYLLFPILAVNSVLAYSLVAPINSLEIIFIINLFFLYFYFRLVYYIWYKKDKNYLSSLNKLTSLFGFIIFFLFSSAIFSFKNLLNLTSLFLLGILFIVSFLFFLEIIRSNKNEEKIWFYAMGGALVLTEIGWTLFLLPFNNNISGLILSICYYVIGGLMGADLKNSLNKRAAKIYLGLGLIGMIAILATAKWK
jgi:hypothetical protein